MINLKTVSLTIFSALILWGGNAFAQGEGGANCEKGPRGARGGGELAGNQNANSQQGGRSAGQGIGPEETAQRMMSNFDEDGDGSLNMQELTNGLNALQQSMRQMQRNQQQGQGGQNQARSNRGGNQGQGQDSLQRGRRGGGSQGTAARGGSGTTQQRGGSNRRGR